MKLGRLMPAMEGAPCVVHGRFGEGTYTLSYSHLETPASLRARASATAIAGWSTETLA